MNRISFACVLALVAIPGLAGAQGFSVRRMAMGGVILGGRQGGEGANVAYRALPKTGHGLGSVSLPIGALQLLGDPPSFDPRDSTFNVYRIANLVENPPWNYAITQPTIPSSDVSLDVSSRSLSMNLGDLGRAFPAGHVRAYGEMGWPSVGFSVRRLFVNLSPLVEFENDLSLNDALTGVLRDGDSVTANRHYAVNDHGRAQAAAALNVGMAMPLAMFGDPRKGGSALYGGVRAKVLRGLAYGEADNVAAFDTGDSLFASQSLDLRYTGRYLDAMPDGGGMGFGMDAGAVWTLGGLEVGLAMDDISTHIDWKVRETVASRDSVSGDLVQTTVREDMPYTSTVPSTMVGNAAFRAGRWTLAADVRRNELATTVHAGLERWLGPVAVRAGGGLDANQRTQLSGGLGIKMGALGLDLAVATNNRNIENERVVELGAGLEVLHR